MSTPPEVLEAIEAFEASVERPAPPERAGSVPFPSSSGEEKLRGE